MADMVREVEHEEILGPVDESASVRRTGEPVDESAPKGLRPPSPPARAGDTDVGKQRVPASRPSALRVTSSDTPLRPGVGAGHVPPARPGGEDPAVSALDADTREQYEQLQGVVRALGSVLVAYSGGVDSALLLKVAVDELGERAVAALADSEAYDAEETSAAAQLAEQMGARLVRLRTRELDDPRYAANGADRCYFCKTELFDQLEPLRAELGLAHVAYGMNRDDHGDWRPGQRAARERGVRAPLDEAGLGKEAIRALARHLGLPVWDKPAEACYSSRIPYGMPVTAEALARIGRAERALRRLGLRQVRVRHHDTVARIEIDPAEFPRLLEPELRERIVAEVRAAGYRYVALDLQGYRTGSLNEALLRASPQRRDQSGK